MHVLRCLLILMALGASAELAAQAVPDTTSPARYAPLHVGNVWHYRDTEWYGSVGIRVERVLRDSTVNDTTYAVVESQRYYRDIDGNEGGSTGVRLVRFDSTRAILRIRTRHGEVDDVYLCRFDTPFPDPQDGVAFCGQGDWSDAQVYGSPAEEVTISDTTITTAVKAFGLLGHGAAWAAGIGQIAVYYDASPVSTLLRYAHIDGVVYGTPLPGFPAVVSTSTSPADRVLVVRAFPSPTAGPITIALDQPTTQHVELAAFDALGRRVWRTELSGGTGRQRVEVDAHAWAPGLYLVRAIAGDASATATVVRR